MGAPDSINAADVYVLRVYVLCKVYTRKDDDDDDNVVLVVLTYLFGPVDPEGCRTMCPERLPSLDIRDSSLTFAIATRRDRVREVRTSYCLGMSTRQDETEKRFYKKKPYTILFPHFSASIRGNRATSSREAYSSLSFPLFLSLFLSLFPSWSRVVLGEA